jgi:hypothetical protein
MKASTRRWLSLSALGLLALDLGAFAIAAPRARGWLESARSSTLLRAGVTAVRDLERWSTGGAQDAGLAALTHLSRRSGNACTFVVRSARPVRVLAQERGQLRMVRFMELEERSAELVGPMVPLSATEPVCPSSSCPNSTCPKRAAEPNTGGTPSAIGLPTSALRITVE